ncbi:hypothetical protein WG70_07735 [Burkholderia oklahomensis EO147]|nr:hypothetical protein WG70_07735 [Burkholderia oklahomensis EO147]AOI49207.1 hypothetical protein WI23_25805 [Burkholderia oklahomensis C6786]KUY51461.1 hypothetical protein WG70_16085 [Burkholderia oklahomensis EO147]KUY60744.1 hypothetical protein WI23_13695 [Burkholderia oklahomensis C6786]
MRSHRQHLRVVERALRLIRSSSRAIRRRYSSSRRLRRHASAIALRSTNDPTGIDGVQSASIRGNMSRIAGFS